MTNSKAGERQLQDELGTSYKEVLTKMVKMSHEGVGVSLKGSQWPNLGQLEHQNV